MKKAIKIHLYKCFLLTHIILELAEMPSQEKTIFETLFSALTVSSFCYLQLVLWVSHHHISHM